LIIALQLVLAQTEKTAKDQSGSNVEAQIKTLADQGRESALKGDTSLVEKNTTSDYMAILPNGNMVGKAEVIQMRKSGDVKYESIDLSDQKGTDIWQHRCLECDYQHQGDDEGQRH
jgi:hypothetical protein